jgi:gamma-glutamyltranspeptidase/glutathione hydrolase
VTPNRWHRWGATRLALAWLGCSLASTVWGQAPATTLAGVAQAQPEASSGWRAVAPTHFQHRGVVTAHPLASQAALDILRAGGSATDALIAAQWVLGLVEPQSSGPGGGAFAVVATAQGVDAFDGREQAPAAAHPQAFLREGKALPFREAQAQPQAVGVPSVVALLWQLHEAHGRLPWSRLTQAAERLARTGFPVSPRLHQALRNASWASQDARARTLYFQASGQPWPVGHRLRNPGYAQLMRAVGEHGPRAFYEGAWAQALMDRVNTPATQWIAASDLRAVTVPRSPALCQPLAPTRAWPQGLRLCGPPPPSSGTLAVAQMLTLWDHRQARLLNDDLSFHLDGLHRWIEAARLAFADRNRYVGDPHEMHRLGIDTASLLTPTYLRERAHLLGPRRMPQALPGPLPTLSPVASMPPQVELGTSHLSVIDGQGQVVSMTSSIEQAFGGGRMVGLAHTAGGYWLNNQLTDFSFQPADPQGHVVVNRMQAGHRPRSSMTPLVVLRGQQLADGLEPVMTLGSPGGSAIISYVALSLQMLREGLPAQAATEHAHVAVIAPNAHVWLEAQRVPESVASGLQALGHPIAWRELNSGLGLLVRTPLGWMGGADPRREGVVLGD